MEKTQSLNSSLNITLNMNRKLNQNEILFLEFLANSHNEDGWVEKEEVLKHLEKQIGKIHVSSFKKNLTNRFLKNLPFIEIRIIKPTRKTRKKICWRLPYEINKQFTLYYILISMIQKQIKEKYLNLFDDRTKNITLAQKDSLNPFKIVENKYKAIDELLEESKEGKFIKTISLSKYGLDTHLPFILKILIGDMALSEYEKIVKLKKRLYEMTDPEEMKEGIKMLNEILNKIDEKRLDLQAGICMEAHIYQKCSGSIPEKNNANGQLNSSQVNSLYKNSTFLDAFQVDEYYKHREVFLEQ